METDHKYCAVYCAWVAFEPMCTVVLVAGTKFKTLVATVANVNGKHHTGTSRVWDITQLLRSHSTAVYFVPIWTGMCAPVSLQIERRGRDTQPSTHSGAYGQLGRLIFDQW